jgi:hypothetical protein
LSNERREHLGFAREARHTIRVGRNRCGQYFDRDVAIELRIFRARYLAHATFAKRGKDLA